MYHYVRPNDPDLPYFRHLDIDAFRAQLDWFANTDTLLSRDAFLDSVRSCNTPPGGGVVLTFDDAFKDHFAYVLRELKSRGLWGIFYVPTGMYRTGRLLDVHRVHMLLGKWGPKAIFQSLAPMISDDMLSHKHVEDFRSATYTQQTNDEYTLHVKRTLNYYISYEYRKRVLDELMGEFFPDEKNLADGFYLSESEIKEMQEAGMLIGSHSISHPVMSKLSVSEQKAEISESFDFLEKATGGLVVRTFCYPYGGFHSFTKDTERLLEDNGCMFSCNVEPRDVTADDIKYRPQALPRYDCNMFPHGSCPDL